MRIIPYGSLVWDVLGHRYQVLAGGPWLYRVQPLTPVDAGYAPLGGPVTIGRSELDTTRLPEGT